MAPKSQIEIPPGKIVPLQEVVLGAEITPPPSGNVRYAWKVSEGCTLMGGSGFKVRVQRTEAGICQVEAIARNAEKVKLGQGATSFEVSAPMPLPSALNTPPISNIEKQRQTVEQSAREKVQKSNHPFDGDYAGQVSGGAGGALRFTVMNGMLKGRVSGNYQGDGVFATLTGKVDEKGNIHVSVTGYVRGALSPNSEMKNWEFTGNLTGKIQGGQASGSWSAKGWGSSKGSWKAKLGRG